MEWTRKGFQDLGFEGWNSFGLLRRADLPKTRGVYVVMTPTNEAKPTFLAESVGGTHKRQALTVPVAELERAWQPGAEVLYIGMAGGTNGLNERLWAYARQGRGRSAGHRGGRYLWQWPGSSNLIVAWRATDPVDAHDVEDALLTLYIEKYGDRPFANMKDGLRFTATDARGIVADWLSKTDGLD